MKSTRFSFSSITALTLLCACANDRSVAPPPPSDPRPPTPPVPGSISVVSGNSQASTIKHTLPIPLVVTVRTNEGIPLPGMTVDWTIPSGDGLMTPTSGVSDADGQVSASLRLGRFPGNHPVVATVRGTSLEAKFDEFASAPIILHYDGTSWSTALEDTFGGFGLHSELRPVVPYWTTRRAR